MLYPRTPAGNNNRQFSLLCENNHAPSRFNPGGAKELATGDSTQAEAESHKVLRTLTISSPTSASGVARLYLRDKLVRELAVDGQKTFFLNLPIPANERLLIGFSEPRAWSVSADIDCFDPFFQEEGGSNEVGLGDLAIEKEDIAPPGAGVKRKAAGAPTLFLSIPKTALVKVFAFPGTGVVGDIPAPSGPFPLTYAFGGDTNGLFHWIGTNGNNVPFFNPNPSKISVSATSVDSTPPNFIAGNLLNLTDRSEATIYPAYSGNNQDIIIDIGPQYRMSPNLLTYRQRRDGGIDHTRFVYVQGKVNLADAWINISINTTDISAGWQTPGNWNRIVCQMPVVTTPVPFCRYFRLRGTLWNKNTNFPSFVERIMVDEVEFYGLAEYRFAGFP